MICVRLFCKDGNFFRLEVSGHSGYAELGKDIVCAAVSSLAQSVIIGLTNMISKDFLYEVDDSKAYLHVDVSCYDSSSLEKAQILLGTFKYTMDIFVVDYEKYVCMEIVEE